MASVGAARVRDMGGDEPYIVARERMLFDRDEMEPFAACRVRAPCLPGGEKVRAGAKTGFDDREPAAPLPARGQAVAPYKYVIGLGERAGHAVIDVAVDRREQRAVVANG